MKTTLNNPLTIVVACDTFDHHCALKRSILENDVTHRISSVYTNPQLMDCLLKKGSYINSPEPLPDCIVLRFNNPAEEIAGMIKQVRYFYELQNIPVYVFSTGFSKAEKESVIAAGATAIYDFNAGDAEVNTFINDHNLKFKNSRNFNPGMAAA